MAFDLKQFAQKAYILPLIIALAVLLLVISVKSKSPLQHAVLQYPVKAVEVIPLQQIPFRSHATAYGYVEPSVLLKYKTEVAGKVSYIHSSLKKGATLAKDTLVLRIEPTTYRFNLEQSKAGLAASESSLKQLEIEEKSSRTSFGLAQQNLQNGETELQRLESLFDKKLVARAMVDAEEQKVLQLRQQVQDLSGKIESFDSRKALILSQIKQSKIKQSQSLDTLGRTEIRLPFDARIGQVNVEKSEFVTTGNLLFEALGIQAVEINAQLPIKQFYPLVEGLKIPTANLTDVKDMTFAMSQFKLKARVNLVGNDPKATWPAELLYISASVDPLRDTLSLVVAVNDPYKGIIPGVRPPLLKGMYVAVELLSAVKSAWVIPRKSIHQNRIYIAGKDNTLRIEPVVVRFTQGELAVIDKPNKISKEDQLIISEVIPVISGMPITALLSNSAQTALQNLAMATKVELPVKKIKKSDEK